MILEVVLLLSTLLLLAQYLNKRPKGLPPGPWGWPLIGHLPDMKVHMKDQIDAFTKQYGKIFSWRVLSRNLVILNDFKMIKAAFNTPSLNDRPDFFSFDVFTNFKKQGLFNANGLVWQNNRRFTLRQLRDLGLGKSSMEGVIQHEAKALVEDFGKHLDKADKLPWSINVAILNVTWALVADKHYNIDDERVQSLNRDMTEIFDGMQSNNTALVDMAPWITKFCPKLVYNLIGLKPFYNQNYRMQKFFMSEVEEQLSTYDPTTERNLIDSYIASMEANKQDPLSTFNIKDLSAVVGDLFFAGSDTTANTIRWILLHLAKYPAAQERCHKEIDSILRLDQTPGLEHRDLLPYCEAVFAEVQRIVPIAPLGLPHFATEDTPFAGFVIPKGAVVFPNIEGCHRDPQYWDKPNEFYPEHFLTEDGKLSSKKEGYLPFSIGKRVCIGESLAKMNISIMVTAILQKYSIHCPPDVPLSEIPTNRDVTQPLFNVCRPFNIIIKERKTTNV